MRSVEVNTRTIVVALSMLTACVGKLESESQSTIAPAAEESAVYVATASDSAGGVSVAVVVQGDHVAAYACGDDPKRELYPGWFIGRAALGGGRSTLSRDGWSVDATWGDDAARGTIVEADGSEVRWIGRRVRGPTITGVYAAHDSGCVTGVIVIGGDDPESSATPVVRGAWCDAEGRVAQVTPVLPIALVDGRLPVDVQRGVGASRIYALRVRNAEP
jgi:hypothetical protein